jgi:transcriptional regulator with XRE-family HTH domain
MAKRVVATNRPDSNTPVNMRRLGQFVRFRRTSMGMTIENAASICGVSKQAFSNVETGLETVKAETIFKVLNCLGVTLWFDQSIYKGQTDENNEWL